MIANKSEMEVNNLYISRQQAQIGTGRTHGKTYREIADDLGVSIGTIAKQLNRLRSQATRCRETLDAFETGEFPHGTHKRTWLSEREAQVLHYFRTEGHSYEEIARKLDITESTVGTHLQNARAKRDKARDTLDILDFAVLDLTDDPRDAHKGGDA